MMRARWVFAVWLLAVGCAVADDKPVDFSTDGCSLFPDGSPVKPNLWCDCCVEHDMAYWRGGTEAERQRADEALRSCVEQRTGNKPFSEMVYAGVRAGGLPIYPTWYRWGYGWPFGRGYKALSEAEAAEAQAKLAAWRGSHPGLNCEDRPAPEIQIPGE